MIALRANDRIVASAIQDTRSAIDSGGIWQATPSCPVVNGVAVGIAFQWQNVTPFGISSVRDYLLDPPPVLTQPRICENLQRGEGRYGKHRQRAQSDSQDRANVALFYDAAYRQLRSSIRPGGRSPQRMAAFLRCPRTQWFCPGSIRAIGRRRGLPDSSTSTAINFWRPETAIHAGIRMTTWLYLTSGSEPCSIHPAPASFRAISAQYSTFRSGGADISEIALAAKLTCDGVVSPAVLTIVLHYGSFQPDYRRYLRCARQFMNLLFELTRDAGARF